MLEKRMSRRPAPGGRRKSGKPVNAGLAETAQRLLLADGKNPYFRGDLTIRNIEELDRAIALFEHHEAPWVADWLEYLGDGETAARIRAEPAHFRRIVHDRAAELRASAR